MDNCTCKITPGTSAYGGNRIDSRGCEKHDTRDEIIEQLRQERDNALRYTELLIAERDTAQAGEARAVEALERIRDGAEVDISDLTNDYEALKLCGYCGGSNDHTDECPHSICVEALADYDGPLAWLARREAEAAAEAWHEAAEHCETTELLMPVPKPGSTLREHGANVCMAMAAELRQRAAALRAGATGGAE